MIEFIHKKTGVKRVVGKDDEVRKKCLMRAGFIPSGEYVEPEVEEVVLEPTVGEVVEAIAEDNPEPEEVPMVAVEATHAAVDPDAFTDLLDAPESEESDGEEEGEAIDSEQVEDLGTTEGSEEAGDFGSDDGVADDVPEIDLQRVADDAGGEVPDDSPEVSDEVAG